MIWLLAYLLGGLATIEVARRLGEFEDEGDETEAGLWALVLFVAWPVLGLIYVVYRVAVLLGRWVRR